MSVRISLLLVLTITVVAWAAPVGMLDGVDISHYQGTVDWVKVKASGLAFGFAKASERTAIDPTFVRNWKAMQAAGIVRGAYHFGHADTDATIQAQTFVTAVNNAGGFKASKTLPLVLDIEINDKVAPAALWAWTQRFCAVVQQMTGRPPIIYTGYYFWTGQMGNPKNNLGAPLWIAAYTAQPTIPPAWSTYTFWQYSDKGTVAGIGGTVDVDYFKGSMNDLLALCYP